MVQFMKPAADARRMFTQRGSWRSLSGGMTPAGVTHELDELDRELTKLKMAVTRLRANNFRLAEARSHNNEPGQAVHSYSPKVSADINAIQGWLFSALESYFAIVWAEYGRDERNATIKVWKEML